MFHLCRSWFNRVIERRHYLRSLQCMTDLTSCVVVRVVTLKTTVGIKNQYTLILFPSSLNFTAPVADNNDNTSLICEERAITALNFR